MTSELRVVKLLESHLCLSCRFAAVTNVEFADGHTEKQWRCKRLDCDNWDFSQPTREFESYEDEETP